MKLEDYINSIKNPPRRRIDETKFTALELDYYTTISYDKKILIKELYPYLDSRSFLDVFDRYRLESSEYAYYQSFSNNGFKTLVRTKICDFDSNTDDLKAVSEEKFYEDYNRLPKSGAQKYSIVKILVHRDVDNYNREQYIQLYYMDDGSVFIDSSTASVLAKMDIHTLGRNLASVCIDLLDAKEKEHSRIRK